MDSSQVAPESYNDLAQLIDYHFLALDATGEDVADACRLAAEYEVRALVVRPIDVEAAKRWLSGTGVRLSSTAGYPDGSSTTATKLYEMRDLLRLGAQEIEFVLSAGKLRDRQFQHIEMELLQASRSCSESGALLKVVFNSRYLPDDAKIIATKICRRVEAAIISVDFTDADTALFQPLLKERLTLKRSDPVETLDHVLVTRSAAYSRIATTDPAAVLTAWKTHLANLTPLPKTEDLTYGGPQREDHSLSQGPG